MATVLAYLALFVALRFAPTPVVRYDALALVGFHYVLAVGYFACMPSSPAKTWTITAMLITLLAVHLGSGWSVPNPDVPILGYSNLVLSYLVVFLFYALPIVVILPVVRGLMKATMRAMRGFSDGREIGTLGLMIAGLGLMGELYQFVQSFALWQSVGLLSASLPTGRACNAANPSRIISA